MNKLTPLEFDILSRYHNRFKSLGFPNPDDLKVNDRINTGSGRYTHISHDGIISESDGKMYLDSISQLDMDGMEAGAVFWVQIENNKALYLEITINGESHWDGIERPWRIL